MHLELLLLDSNCLLVPHIDRLVVESPFQWEHIHTGRAGEDQNVRTWHSPKNMFRQLSKKNATTEVFTVDSPLFRSLCFVLSLLNGLAQLERKAQAFSTLTRFRPICLSIIFPKFVFVVLLGSANDA